MQNINVIYQLSCLKCGKEFEYNTPHKSYCPECSLKLKRESNRKHMARKRAKSKLQFKDIHEVVAEVKAYNEQHGTMLSYGQYVALERMGKLL